MSDTTKLMWTPGTGKSDQARKFFKPEPGREVVIRLVGEPHKFMDQPKHIHTTLPCRGVSCGVCKATGVGFWSRMINHIKRWF